MKKSTRALTGMIVLDALLVAGAAWMVLQVQTGTWNTPDPATRALLEQRIRELGYDWGMVRMTKH